jgi:hypothetical protein
MLRLVKLSPDLVGTTSASILAYLLVAAKKFIVALQKKNTDCFGRLTCTDRDFIALKNKCTETKNTKTLVRHLGLTLGSYFGGS